MLFCILQFPKMFSCQTLYLLLVAFTLIIYTEQQTKDPAFVENVKKIQAECSKEIGIELEYVQKNWKENRFPNDDKLKCFYKCQHLNLGIINEKGEVVDDVLRKAGAIFNDGNTTREIVEECGGIEGTDLCDTAYKLSACVKAAQID